MKIVDIINEGLIKTPNNLVNEVFLVACSDIFSRIFTYFDNAEDQDEAFEYRLIFEKIYKKYRSKFGKIDIHDDMRSNHITKKRVYLNLADVEKNYLNAKNKKPIIKYAIDIVAITTDYASKYINEKVYGEVNKKSPIGLYVSRNRSEVPKIYIFVPEITLMSYLNKPEFFDSFMERIYDKVDHELAHAIQDLVFDQFKDEASEETVGTSDEEKHNYYHLKDIEFSPLTKTYAREFTSYLKRLKARNIHLTDEQKKELFKAFIDPDYKLSDELEDYRSTGEFFVSLKRKDFPKWKKAVKYAYGLLNDPNFKFEV